MAQRLRFFKFPSISLIMEWFLGKVTVIKSAQKFAEFGEFGVGDDYPDDGSLLESDPEPDLHPTNPESGSIQPPNLLSIWKFPIIGPRTLHAEEETERGTEQGRKDGILPRGAAHISGQYCSCTPSAPFSQVRV